MAAKQANPVVRIIATVFTSVVAPTLVALLTTSIRDSPHPLGTQTVSTYPSDEKMEDANPTVTLLPPAPLPMPMPTLWRPAAAAESSAAGTRNVARY